MSKVAIVANSNGLSKLYENEYEQLLACLSDMGRQVVCSDFIFQDDNGISGTNMQRAQALNALFENQEIEEIYDISGGDMGNGVLPYLDYEMIKKSKAIFWGYSDLTTVINGIYTCTGKASVLYQIRNLVWENAKLQMQRYVNRDNLFDIDYKFIQGGYMSGTVIGGNIRCFLKLAGTSYFPDLEGKILFLEARSGNVSQMHTYFAQLQQLGAFQMVKGIFLGTFSEMERDGKNKELIDIIRSYTGTDLPIAKTQEIGHGSDSKAIYIGKELELSDK